MAAQKKKPITLLPQEGFETTTLGHVLSWALTAGRAIVILTELAVILAFISRFWFDRTLTDLNDQIKQKSTLINASSSFEQQYRSVQTRLVTISQLTQQSDPATLTDTILAQVPPEVKLNQLSLKREVAQITGVSLTEAGIELLISQLEKTELGEVTLSQLGVASGEEIGIKFTITITMKGTKQ